MALKKILLAIPLFIAIGCIIDSWITILTSDYTIRWQHYTALVFLAIVIYFYFKNFTKAVISTGVFFIIGTLNMFSMTADIETMNLGIGPLITPPFNSLSLGLLFLFSILNLVTMMNMYLDHKEMKNKKSV
jgi:hypothetical protein